MSRSGAVDCNDQFWLFVSKSVLLTVTKLHRRRRRALWGVSLPRISLTPSMPAITLSPDGFSTFGNRRRAVARHGRAMAGVAAAAAVHPAAAGVRIYRRTARNI